MFGEYRRRLAQHYINLGVLQSESGENAAARASYQRAVESREKLVAENPAIVEFQVDLGGIYCDLAHLLLDQGDPSSAVDGYARAAETLQRVLDQEPRHPTARRFLLNTCWGRGQALDALGRHAEAAADWRRAAELGDGKQRTSLLLHLAEALARAGHHARAAKEAAALAAAANPSFETLYRLAGVFSLCAAAAKDNAALAEAYAARAVELLQRSGLF
ncbi:MAG TPA: tetratricopeptide repeat protein [Pirellulales bacterium]|nr:tetratricopeptide repeat protein [Pirellulales bacterium]